MLVTDAYDSRGNTIAVPARGGVGVEWVGVIFGYPTQRILTGLHSDGGLCPAASLVEVQEGLAAAGFLPHAR